MKLITAHQGQLHSLGAIEAMGRVVPVTAGPTANVFHTGLQPLDALLSDDEADTTAGLPRAAIHEILSQPGNGPPLFFATILARAAGGWTTDHATSDSPKRTSEPPAGAIVWCDPHAQLYPPALAAMGIPMHRLFLLRPKDDADRLWAIAECLRCKAVSAVVAPVANLSQIQARRLQLAAETGGGVGILLRQSGKATSAHYAAATRWLVAPTQGERTVQRWTVQLLHGHGRRLGQSVCLEYCRETHLVRATDNLAHRSPAKTPGKEANLTRPRILVSA